SVEEIAPVMFAFAPSDVPVTFTVIVQVGAAEVTVPPDRLIEPEPATAVIVAPPPQFPLVLSPFGVATTRPPGRLSLNAMPVRLVEPFGLLIVKVSDVVPFKATLPAPNALLMVGGATTVSCAVLLVAPVPLSVELIAVVVLLFTPAVVPVTLTEIVQL